MILKVARGLATRVASCRRDAEAQNQRTIHSNVSKRTYVAVCIELDLSVVGPYDEVRAIRHVFEEKPEAKYRDTSTGALPR